MGGMDFNGSTISLATLNSSLKDPPPSAFSIVQRCTIEVIQWRNRTVCHPQIIRKGIGVVGTEIVLPFLIVAAAIEAVFFSLLLWPSVPFFCCRSKPFHRCLAHMVGASSTVVMGISTFVYGNLLCKKAKAESFAGWNNTGSWRRNSEDPGILIYERSAFADFSQDRFVPLRWSF